MDFIIITEKEIIDTETEANYGLINKLEDATGVHCHDFFEFFLITKGNVMHVVNGIKQPLTDGCLVFIRPEDIHYYENPDDESFEVVNLAFPAATIHALFDYLGRDFLPDRFYMPGLPPTAVLSKAEKDIIKSRLDKLFTIPFSQKTEVKMELRTLLAELFTRHFMVSRQPIKTFIPDWLNRLCSEMQKKEYFTEGLEAIQKLADKSPEHLCRIFKKYLNRTPTDFINQLRLNYAANLLMYSDKTIVDISMDSGFENLSHFYHRFKKEFTISPAKFRKTHQKIVIP